MCAPGPSAASTRAATPPRGWNRSYVAVKAASTQDNFIPFILETRGRVNKAAHEWLDTLTAPEPVPSQDDYDRRNPFGAHNH